MEEYWKKLRSDFRVFEKDVYLQTQGGGPISNSLINFINKRLIQLSVSGGDVCDDWEVRKEIIRKDLGDCFGANYNNVAFIPSTSYAMNLLSYCFDNKMGVLTFIDDFPNSYIPWLNRGFDVKRVPSKNGIITFDSIQNGICSKTKILITSHVMYRTGFRQNLKAIGELCRERDIYFIVDCTQSFGVFNINVDNCNIDALMFHGYKWINAGYGIGGLFLSKRILELKEKPFLGFNSLKKLNSNDPNLNYSVKKEACVFETGKPAFMNILMLGHQLDIIREIGIQTIQKRVLNLVEFAIKMLRKNSIEVMMIYEGQNLSGILNIKAYGISKKMLKSNNIIARSNSKVITIGIHYYNNEDDISKLIKVINSQRCMRDNDPK